MPDERSEDGWIICNVLRHCPDLLSYCWLAHSYLLVAGCASVAHLACALDMRPHLMASFISAVAMVHWWQLPGPFGWLMLVFSQTTKRESHLCYLSLFSAWLQHSWPDCYAGGCCLTRRCVFRAALGPGHVGRRWLLPSTFSDLCAESVGLQMSPETAHLLLCLEEKFDSWLQGHRFDFNTGRN